MKTLFPVVLFFLLFAPTCASYGSDVKPCGDPPLSREQLIDIYIKEIHKNGGAPVRKIKEDRVYVISERDCIYRVGSHRPQHFGDGPYVEINRKGVVLSFTPMP
jgi:hypothetical protein